MFAFKMPGLSEDVQSCQYKNKSVVNAWLIKWVFIKKFNSFTLLALLALIEFTGHSETTESVLFFRW